MKKLIATEFVYTVLDDHTGQPVNYLGSYLGRVPASPRTLRAFVRQGIKSTGVPWRIQAVKRTSSYVSQWIAK